MKKKILMIFMVSLLLSIILWISGLMPVIHEFNVKLLKGIVSLF